MEKKDSPYEEERRIDETVARKGFVERERMQNDRTMDPGRNGEEGGRWSYEKEEGGC